MEFFSKINICYSCSNLAANLKLSMSRQHEFNGRKTSCHLSQQNSLCYEVRNTVW